MASEAPWPISTLSLNSLRLKVSLGCSAQEREIPQYVRFDVRLRFHSLPGGCLNDQLEETVCYESLSNVIKTVCLKQEYKLIEKLGYDVYCALKEALPPKVKLWMQATKEKPPILNLEGGTTFSLGDDFDR